MPIKGKNTGLWQLFAVILIVLTSAVGSAVAYLSPLFSLKSITVNGADLIHPDLIRKKSGVILGTPLLQLNDLEIAKRISGGFLAIKKTIVHRQFPHTLVITVQERVALAIVHQKYVIDCDGVIFGTTSYGTDMLPILDTPSPGPQDAYTREALLAYTELPQLIKDQIKRISAPSLVSITFYLRNGKKIIFGSAEDAAAKNIAMAALITRPGKIYNVSNPQLPVIEPTISR